MINFFLIAILIIYFSVNYKFLGGKSYTEILLKMLFLYVFVFGVLEYFIMDFIRKILIDLLVILLCFIQFQKANFKFPGIKWFLVFTTFFVISTIFTSSGLYESFTYYRTFFYPYIVFLVVYNLRMPQKNWDVFNKFVFSLFILQIIASIFKFIFIGVSEKTLIGTISSTGGTFSTMIPLTAIAFIFSFFMIYKQDYKYILISLGFLLMGYTGAKRGIWLYLPIVLLISLYAYKKVTGFTIISKKLIGLSFFLILFSVLTVVFGSKYSTTLNPDKNIGGRFELDYLQEYTIDYTFASSSDSELTQGRGANFLNVLKKMKDGDLINFAFGFGPESGKGVRTYGEGIWEYLGVNGPVTGLTYHIVQLGILCNIFILMFLLKCTVSLFRLSKSESDLFWKAFIFGELMITIVFLIDFVTYSSSFISTIFPLSFTYAYIAALCYKRFIVHHGSINNNNINFIRPSKGNG